MGKKFGFSWSWKRASGLSALRGKVARATGIPTTRYGRQRKVGRMLGCFLVLITITAAITSLVAFSLALVR
jgi:hypothetical protein